MNKIILVVTLFVIGCSVNPSKLSDKYADELVNKITYAKDHRTGLCYGVIASRKTGDTNSSGIGITLVPCDDVDQWMKK